MHVSHGEPFVVMEFRMTRGELNDILADLSAMQEDNEIETATDEFIAGLKKAQHAMNNNGGNGGN